MLSFSQRMGYKSVKSIMQIETIDYDLRVGLWNVLHNNLWSKVNITAGGYLNKTGVYTYLTRLWGNYLKMPANLFPYKWNSLLNHIHEYYFKAQWYEVYDFIEFLVKAVSVVEKPKLIKELNQVLKGELSAYRFVNNELVKITSDEEIVEIEQATQVRSSIHFASTHINEALKLLAEKQNPDYRNSIKESISAVEAICTAITKASGSEASTLGAALKAIEKEGRIELHPALKGAFDKLYGYTSDDGIRHFLKSDKEVNFEDAKFMLVACSAFVNYLTEKSGKAGLNI